MVNCYSFAVLYIPWMPLLIIFFSPSIIFFKLTFILIRRLPSFCYSVAFFICSLSREEILKRIKIIHFSKRNFFLLCFLGEKNVDLFGFLEGLGSLSYALPFKSVRQAFLILYPTPFLWLKTSVRNTHMVVRRTVILLWMKKIIKPWRGGRGFLSCL